MYCDTILQYEKQYDKIVFMQRLEAIIHLNPQPVDSNFVASFCRHLGLLFHHKTST